MKISDIARRVAKQRARRTRGQAALDEILEPAETRAAPPGRLYPGPAPVIDLAQARAQRRRQPRRRPVVQKSRRALLAALIGAAGCGALMMTLVGRTELLHVQDGQLIARGALDAALSAQLTGQAPAGERILLTASWRARDGEICRNFSIAGASLLAGTACRDHRRWQVRSLGNPGGPVTANTSHTVSFTPLSNGAEHDLRAHGWQSP